MKATVLSFSIILVIAACTVSQSEKARSLSLPDESESTATITHTLEPEPSFTLTIPTVTVTIIPTPTEVVKEFSLCPNIENFRDCVILEEELLDGTYFYWLKQVVAPTILPIFEANRNTIVDDIAMKILTHGGTSMFSYDPNTVPNYPIMETRPFNRFVTFGYTDATWLKEIEGAVADGYQVLPVFFYDKELNEVFPVITIAVIDLDDEGSLRMHNDIYVNENNVTPIISTNILPEGFGDPFVTEAFDRIGWSNMERKMEQFRDGDYSALSEPGIIVLTSVSHSPGGWYK